MLLSLKTFPIHRLIFVILLAPLDNFCTVAVYKSLFVCIQLYDNLLALNFQHC